MSGRDLSRYRWHTGAPLRRVDPDEPTPVLFRDIGPVALHSFLSGTLSRLSGPYTPLLYMRTARFVEPFVDYAKTGRLVFLDARSVGPWHSGVPQVYVARAGGWPAAGTLGYVPGDARFDAVAEAGPRTVDELRELLGGPTYDERREHDLHALRRLNEEAATSERWAHPLRQALQSPDPDRRRHARRLMQAADIDDQVLCAAWHHLPAAQRQHLVHTLRHLDLSVLGSPTEAR